MHLFEYFVKGFCEKNFVFLKIQRFNQTKTDNSHGFQRKTAGFRDECIYIYTYFYSFTARRRAASAWE